MIRYLPLRAVTLALLLVSLSGSAAGPALDKYRDWSKSPEFVYLATDAEVKDWKQVKTDAEAEKFIAVFWARRNPDLRNPANEFRQRFEKLVELADKHFTLANGKRGSLTERGKVYILVGPPKTLSSEAGTKPHAPGMVLVPGSVPTPTEFGGGGENPPGTTIGESIMTFTYEAKQLPEWASIKSLEVKFAVEQTRDSIIKGDGDARRLETLAPKVALKNPDLKNVPREEVKTAAATSKPVEAPPPQVSPAASAALDAAMAKEPFGAVSVLPLAYRDGGLRLMMQVYLEGPAPAEPARFAWLIRGKDGKDVVRAEETAGLQKLLKGAVVDRAIPVLPGDYDVAVVLLDASGAVVHSAKRSVTVLPVPTDFGASPLFLAIADLPAEGAKPEAPFVFVSRKFVARGDGHVKKTDGISFLVRLYNPGVDPSTKKAFVKRTLRIQPKGRPAVDLPVPPDEPMALPNTVEGGAVVLDMAGTVADNNIGDYFRPGEYTFKVIVEDAVRKTKLEVSESFTLMAPER